MFSFQFSLSPPGSFFSTTSLSNLSIVGTCDIFVCQTCRKIMWCTRMVDSNLLLLICLQYLAAYGHHAVRVFTGSGQRLAIYLFF